MSFSGNTSLKETFESVSVFVHQGRSAEPSAAILYTTTMKHSQQTPEKLASGHVDNFRHVTLHGPEYVDMQVTVLLLQSRTQTQQAQDEDMDGGV